LDGGFGFVVFGDFLGGVLEVGDFVVLFEYGFGLYVLWCL